MTKKMGLRIRSALRHIVNAARLRRSRSLRLHLGCGEQRHRGFINIDSRFTPATDYIGDIVALPCRAGSVERIEAFHVIEHLRRPEVPVALRAWRKMLQAGGTLILECPDFEKDIREYLAGNSDRLNSIFGRQRYPGDAHYWGYTAGSLVEDLRSAGFQLARTASPIDYHATMEPCIRVEGVA